MGRKRKEEIGTCFNCSHCWQQWDTKTSNFECMFEDGDPHSEFHSCDCWKLAKQPQPKEEKCSD